MGIASIITNLAKLLVFNETQIEYSKLLNLWWKLDYKHLFNLFAHEHIDFIHFLTCSWIEILIVNPKIENLLEISELPWLFIMNLLLFIAYGHDSWRITLRTIQFLIKQIQEFCFVGTHD